MITDHGTDGLDVSLTDDLTIKVMEERNNVEKEFRARYREITMNLRSYVNMPKSVNSYKLEWYLRNGWDIVIGKNSLGVLCILGGVKNDWTTTDPSNPFTPYALKKANIQWFIKKSLIPTGDMFEITHDDDATTGDFAVIRNKPVCYVSDWSIIDRYASRIAEIQASRLSLIIQAKNSKLIQGDLDNETINQIIAANYNGAPYIKTAPGFNPTVDIMDMSNPQAGELMKTYKEMYNDEIGELNNILGINSAGIDKSSGVSEAEVSSNNEVVQANGNMYVNGPQQGFNLINKRWGYDIHTYMNREPTNA